MHELEFAIAAAPPRVVCLGLPLKTYTLGHEFELWRQNNPLLTGTLDEFSALLPAEQLGWLMRAADFCSQDSAEWLETETLLASRPRWWQFSARRRKSRLEQVWRQWEAQLPTPDEPDVILEQAIRFRHYLIAGRRLPPFPTPEAHNVAAGRAPTDNPGGRELGSPLLPRLINFVTDRPALLNGRPWQDMPFGETAWLYFTQAEMDGTSVIENEAEHKAAAHERQLMAEIEAERAAAAAAETKPDAPAPAEPLNDTPCQH